MALGHIPLDQFTEEHLRELIQIGAPETLYIEYKRQAYRRDDRLEFLKDISSFANAAGGDLVIGMAAEKGIPSKITPFGDDVDAEKLWLEEVARKWLDPRIPNLRVHTVRIEDGSHVIVIRVPRSFIGPHRVTFDGHNRFWARSSGGKYEPNVQELRHLFTEAPHIAQRIREFRFDRIARIEAGEAPVNLASSYLLVMHVIPFSAFDLRQSLSIATIGKHWQLFPPLGRPAPLDWEINFDGFLGLSNGDSNAVRHASYVQVFHNGVVEGVSNIGAEEGNKITLRAAQIEGYLVGTSKKWAEALATCGIACPLAVVGSIIGAKNAEISSGLRRLKRDARIIAKPQLHFPEAIIDELPERAEGYANILRIPILDRLWNLAGYTEAQTFASDGTWRWKD